MTYISFTFHIGKWFTETILYICNTFVSINVLQTFLKKHLSLFSPPRIGLPSAASTTFDPGLPLFFQLVNQPVDLLTVDT